MSHVTEQKRTALISNSPEPGVVPVSGVGTPTANDQSGPEIQGLLLQLVVINVPSSEIHLVGQTLEVDRGRRDLLPSGCVVPMSEVTTGGKVQPHDAVMGLENSRVGGEIGRRSGVRLNIDAPLGSVEVKGLEGSSPAQILDLVDEFVTAVVTVTGHALGVLVGQGTAESLDDGEGGEILGGNELDAAALATLLLLDEVVDLGVHALEVGVSPSVYCLHWGERIGREEEEEEMERRRLWRGGDKLTCWGL